MTKAIVWILGDQLLAHHPALEAAVREYPKHEIRVLLVESRSRMQTHPYQRKKLVLLISAMRHYANELQEAGYIAGYAHGGNFTEAIELEREAFPSAKWFTMESASYPGRMFQRGMSAKFGIDLTLLPNTQFLTGQFNPIPSPALKKRYVMENFYRDMRREFDILLEDGEPVGGKWNFDKENRKKLPKTHTPPRPITFTPDKITQEVMQEVTQLKHGVGKVDNFGYAVTRADALHALDDFITNRLRWFGDYEDALTRRSHAVYHSLLSPYLNLGLLEPLEVACAAEAAYHAQSAPINAAEGLVRQVIGWREFMYWQYWRQMPGMTDKNAWNAHNPLPNFVWTGETDMACMQHAITRALDTGYNHHIERLMILCNFFMLTGINPKAVNDWFLAVYVDAYDWVMPPNVIGMGLNADGGLTSTKPYIASANYINKMGDFCRTCHFDPKQRTGDNACPFNALYWNFILQHEDRLRSNPRTSRNVLGLRYLDDDERIRVRQRAEQLITDFTT